MPLARAQTTAQPRVELSSLTMVAPYLPPPKKKIVEYPLNG